MKKILKNRPIFILVGIFVVVLFLVVGFTFKFGQAYKGLTEFARPQIDTQEFPPEVKEKIRTIRLKKKSEIGCIEVDRDGVVRIYTICEEDLSRIQRSSDLKTVFHLFRIVSETDLAKYHNLGEGEVYELTVETDEGTYTYFLIVGDDTPDSVEEIIETVENVEEDLPDVSPSPSPTTPAPSASPHPSVSAGGATPSPSFTSPSPSPEGSQGGFACDFSDSGGKRPVNVSNVICTSDPSPIP